METCYRHPDRETAVHCSNCGRAICPECMTYAAVGVRCPECIGHTPGVRRAGFAKGDQPRLTYALIAANVVIFLATNNFGVAGGPSIGGSVNALGRHLAVYGPAVANGQYYRLVTSAFLHFGLLHLAFNMYALYILGAWLERYVGSLRFGAIYLISVLCGSFGALLLSPDALTGGASGAIFGLMGALLLLERGKGLTLLRSPIGVMLIINLGFTFAYSGQISVGGHLGGLAGGLLAGFVLSGYGRGHMAYGRITASTALGLVVVAGAAVAGSLAVA